jgi:hypothetical protein
MRILISSSPLLILKSPLLKIPVLKHHLHFPKVSTTLCIMSLLIPKKMMLHLNRNNAAKSEFHSKPVRPLADEALIR